MKMPYTYWLVAVTCTLLTLCNVDGRTWLGGSGNWTDTAKWDPAGAPQAGESIIITNAGAVVTLSNQTEWLDSFLLSNSATLFYTNYDTNTTVCLQATNVFIYGTVTQAVNTVTATNAAGEWPVDSQIYIACSNFTLGTAGKINGNGCGYLRSTWTNGYGPGGGKYYGNFPGGGGYGGRGATGGNGTSPGGVSYGSATNPAQPGSAGGGYNSGNPGGNGGGLVRIEATGRVTVNGTISVNGAAGSAGGAGGSGGGIYIGCGTVEGSGIISANGGNGGGGTTESGGGGGGRIAVQYEPTTQSGVMPAPTIAFSANPSVSSAASYNQPRPGSLYLPDASFFPTPVSLGCEIANPVSTSCVLSSLTVTNDSLLIFPTGTVIQITGNLLISGKGGIELPYGSLTVGTNAVFSSAASPFGSLIRLATNGLVSVGSNLTVSTGPLRVYGDTTNIASITVGGDMLVTNSAKFYLYCGTSNALANNFSALVAVTGDVTITSGSWIYPASHAISGGSALFRMRNLNLLAGGGFNADGLGYGSPSVVGRGYGPGGGGYTSNRGGGGGFGGVGGIAEAVAGTGGPICGSSNAPVDPGSGGGSHGPGGNIGGAGGGLVRIEADGTASIAGSITANGATGNAAGGGGSGGGIYIRCQSTTGAGTISANGGIGLNNSGFIAGNGGGGRVALTDWLSDGFNGSITVNPGTGSGNAGGTGTVRRIAQAGTINLIVRGYPAPHGSSSYPYNDNSVIEGATITNTVNSPAEEANGVRYVCVGWTLTNQLNPAFLMTGTTTQAIFQVTSNLVQTWLWTNMWYLSLTSAPNGSIQTDVSGWYTNGVTVPVTAIASNGYAFSQWSGTGTPPDITNSTPTLVMDRVRTLQANFASLTPVNKVWSGTGNWATPSNWTPPGIPGQQDTVTVASGTATLSDSTTLGSLRITNAAILILTNASLTCLGDLALTNTAKFYVHGGVASGSSTNCNTWVDVRGDMLVSPNTWVYPTSHPTNGGSPTFRMRDLSVLSGGGFNANGRGFVHQVGASVPGRGPGAGGAGGGRSGGGGYGGTGGCPVGVTGGLTYGSSNAPIDPGSSAGNHSGGDLGGDGGGLIHITASRNITLNGALTANGINGAGGAGGGSGGGIYLSCRTLSGSAPISANGGAGVNSDAGAGGGGRIAIWAGYRVDYSGTVTKIKGAQWYGADGTLVWGPQLFGSVYSIR